MAFTTDLSELIEHNRNGLLGKHPSWRRARLGDVAYVQNGAAFKSEYFNTEGRGMPLLRIRDVVRGTTETWYAGPYTDEYVVRRGDLVVGMDGEFNHALWGGPPALLNQRVCRLVFKDDDLKPEWVYHILGGYLHAVNEATPSVTVKHLSSKTVADLLLPCPPLGEQDRIVARMDNLCLAIERGERHFDLARQGAAEFRAAVLRDALDGPWNRVPLKDTLHSLKNGVFVSRPAVEPPGVPIYRISAVRPMLLNQQDFRYAPADLAGYERYLVQGDDLLFTRYSGNAEYVGACARVPATATPALHPDKLIRGVVDRLVADPAFLELACSGGTTWQAIRASRKTTAGQVGISGQQLAAVEVPLPPLNVQRDIVQHCNRQLEAGRAFETDLGRVSGGVTALKQALIYAAVAGTLVPQKRRKSATGPSLPAEAGGRADVGTPK